MFAEVFKVLYPKSPHSHANDQFWNDANVGPTHDLKAT